MNRKVTEADVFVFYKPVLMNECSNAYKGIEWEDRLAEASLAVIHAIRTYKVEYGEFFPFMQSQVQTIMKQKNKQAWSQKRLEARLPLNSGAPGNRFGYWEDSTEQDVHLFFYELSSIEQNVVDLLISGHPKEEVAKRLSLKREQLENMICSIQWKWRQFADV